MFGKMKVIVCVIPLVWLSLLIESRANAMADDLVSKEKVITEISALYLQYTHSPAADTETNEILKNLFLVLRKTSQEDLNQAGEELNREPLTRIELMELLRANPVIFNLFMVFSAKHHALENALAIAEHDALVQLNEKSLKMNRFLKKIRRFTVMPQFTEFRDKYLSDDSSMPLNITEALRERAFLGLDHSELRGMLLDSVIDELWQGVGNDMTMKFSVWVREMAPSEE